jgi:hypothetical protein
MLSPATCPEVRYTPSPLLVKFVVPDNALVVDDTARSGLPYATARVKHEAPPRQSTSESSIRPTGYSMLPPPEVAVPNTKTPASDEPGDIANVLCGQLLMRQFDAGSGAVYVWKFAVKSYVPDISPLFESVLGAVTSPSLEQPSDKAKEANNAILAHPCKSLLIRPLRRVLTVPTARRRRPLRKETCVSDLVNPRVSGLIAGGLSPTSRRNDPA